MVGSPFYQLVLGIKTRASCILSKHGPLSYGPAPLSALYLEKMGGGVLTSLPSWDYGPTSLDPAGKWKHCLFSALSKRGQAARQPE